MGGQRIDDHGFWAGGRSKGSVFPDGAKVKSQADGRDGGDLSKYEDTSEAIHHVQGLNVSKMKGHGRKDYMRN